ncbi:CGNR zinc finger domain-containing protein [Microlunatus speluncae]|uniref:CGNR zinc finger domain-containing protein n=1 Tax=Microlunatus speluncae TaxID=2594267 RepID=UPI0012662C29|nr:CGNR zinc finger domain-containing protein [Microlunatus speluncae]
MQLNPYGVDGVVMAQDLANRPPATEAELRAICDDHGLIRERPITQDDLELVALAIKEWLAVVDAPDHDERSQRVNAMTAAYCSFPTLTDHARTGWHLHYRPDGISVGHQVGAMMAAGTALHLAGRGITRLGRCDVTDCDRVYVDLTRNGRQRYCSPACANRDAVRRHRARQR